MIPFARSDGAGLLSNFAALLRNVEKPDCLRDLFKMAQPSPARHFVCFILRGAHSLSTWSWPDIQSFYKAGIVPTKNKKKKKLELKCIHVT